MVVRLGADRFPGRAGDVAQDLPLPFLYSWAEVDLGPERINTGGVTAGALFGFRW